MKKLLQINIVSNTLSTGTIVEDISKVAQAKGWNTYVCYGRNSKPGVNKEYRIGSKLESIWHYIENRLFDNEGLASRFATFRLINHIKKVKPDIIHLHNIHDHYLNYWLLFNYLNHVKIPVVWTFHDYWGITGHCHHFIDAHCEKWKTKCCQCPLQHSTVNSLMDRSKRNYALKKKLFSANQNLTIVPVSVWVEQNVRESFLKNKRIITIPNGIDIGTLINQPEEEIPVIPKKCFVILGIARDWEHGDRKGFDDFLRLSERLKKDEVIVLVGTKKEQIKSLPDNVIGIERTTSKQRLVNIYRSANVLVSLSAAETFGLTVIEANALGVPAVVYDNTAPPSLITPMTGYVAKNKDLNDVYNKISIIRAKGGEYYSKACVEHVKRFYDKNSNYCKYLDLYEDLIGHKNEKNCNY